MSVTVHCVHTNPQVWIHLQLTKREFHPVIVCTSISGEEIDVQAMAGRLESPFCQLKYKHHSNAIFNEIEMIYLIFS